MNYDTPWSFPPAHPCDRLVNGPSVVSNAASAAPSSSVHTEETKEGSPTTNDDSIPTPSEHAVAFRHSFWSGTRAKVLSALQDTHPHAVAAFRDCGSVAWVMQHPERPDQLRVATNKCHSRWCQACAGEKRRRATWVLQDHFKTLKGTPLRFLTLTLKSDDQPLGGQVDRLYECFRRFRERKKIHDLIAGGIAFLEVTWSEKIHAWHPHLHVLFTGQFLPQRLAALEWHDVTQDSFIVDVRAVREQAALSYVAKYLGKGISSQVFHNPQLLREVLTEMHGRRTCATFGTWRGLKLSEPPKLDCQWNVLGTLHQFLARAAAGEPDAVRVISLLRRPRNEPIDFPGRDPPASTLSGLPADAPF